MKFYQRRSVRAALVTVGLAAVLFGVVHTRPVARLVADRIEASQAGRLRIGQLTYRLWRREVTLRDVSWTQRELTVTIPEIAIDVALTGDALHEVRLSSPRAQWHAATPQEGPETALQLPAPPRARFEISDGSLFVESQGIEASGIDVTFAPSSGTLRVSRIAHPQMEASSLQATFTLDGNAVSIDSAAIEGYGTTLSLSGSVDLDTDRQSFEASFAELDLSQFDERLGARATGRLEGVLVGFDYRTLEGEGHLTVAPDPEGEIRFEIRDEQVHFESPRIASKGIEGSIDGSLTATADIEARFRGRARLAELLPTAEGSVIAEGTLTGSLDGIRAEASVRSENLLFEGTPLEVDGNVSFADGKLQVRAANVAHESGVRAVLDGEVSDVLRLSGRATYAREPDMKVEAALNVTGALSAPLVEATLTAEAGGGRLTGTGRFEAASRRISLRGEGADMPITGVADLAGRLEDLRFDVEGTVDAPHVEGTALLADVSYRGVSFEDTLVTAETDGKQLTLMAGQLLSATTVLEAPFPTEVRLSLDAIPLSELVSTFPRAAETELSVSGDALLELPLQEPSSVRYRIEGRNALAVYRGIVLGTSAPFVIEGDRDSLRIEELDLIGVDTAVGLSGRVPLSSSGDVELDARGAVRLDILHLWFPEAELSGRANVTVHIGGTLEAPEWVGDVVIDELGASLGSATIAGGNVAIDGQRSPGQPVRLRIEAENVVAKSDAGEIEMSLSGEFASDDELFSTLEGKGDIERLVARGGGLELVSRGSSSFQLADSLLTIDPVVFEKDHTTLTISGTLRPFGDTVEWNAGIDGNLDHALFNTALSELGLTFSGTTDIEVRASNANGELTVNGEGGFRDARLTLRDPPLVFSSMNGAFTMEGSTLRLDSLTADAGGGKVGASGTVVLSGTELAEVSLAATASAVRLSYPEGLRSEIEGELRLTGQGDRLRLTGDIALNRAVFSRDIDVETELLQSIESVAGLAEPDGFAESVQLDIRVSAEDGLRIDNNLARLDTTANLTLGGTLGTPELRGIVASRPGGRFRFGRNDYVVESARIQLNAYPAEPANIAIDARTTVRNYDLRLSVSGPTDDLVTEFSAPEWPELSQGDVASLLLTGRTLDTVSSESRAVLGEQMASYLGSTLGDLAQMGLGNALPFQLVTVEPSLIAQEADPAARFTLGAGITNELTVVYSIGLDDAESQIWIVDYELPRRIRTQLVRRDDNEFSLGATQKLQYDPGRRDGASRSRVNVSAVSVRYLDDVPPESATEIARRLRPKRGDRWDYWDAWEHAERIRERLRDEGYLEATVDVVTTPCGDGCIEVAYDVVLGVPVAFLWRGDAVDDSIREAVRESWNGQLGEAFVATDLETLAEGRLFAKRYYLAEVSATTQRTDQGVTVTVEFSTGPRGERIALELDGNDALPDRLLRDALPGPSSAEFYQLLTTRRPRLKQLLELRYASYGYLTAEIDDPEQLYDTASGTLTVRIPVREGPLFHTDSLELQGVEAFELQTLRAQIPLKEGAVFRPADFVQSRATLASYYRQRGFPDVAVTASLLDSEEPGRLGARFAVNEGRRATVATIAVAGNDNTKENVVLREAAFTVGETLRLSDVNETQKRLYELGAFRSAEVVVSDPTDGESGRDVTIRVREMPRLSFDYGLRVATDGLFQIDTEIGVPNLFGRAHHASFRTLIATDERIFRLNYHMPYFARFELDTDFFLERKETTQGESDAREWSLTAQQTRRLREGLTAQWSYSFKRELFFVPIIDTLVSENRGAVSISVIGDRRDNIVRPRSGSFWSSTFQALPGALGSSEDRRLVKLYSQLFAFLPIAGDMVWASGYRIGFGRFGSFAASDDRFSAGGPNSIRGFPQDTLGPNDAMVVINQELRFPLVWRLRGAGFWDTGNTFDGASAVRLSEFRHSIGAGIRVEVPFGVVRFDLARIINRREDEPKLRFVFSLGHAF